MFTRLVITTLVLVSFNVAAQDAPVQFQNMKAASQWFDNVYPSHEMRRYAVKMPDGDPAEVYGVSAHPKLTTPAH